MAYRTVVRCCIWVKKALAVPDVSYVEKMLKNIWIFCKKGIDKLVDLWYNTREKKAEQPFSPCRNGAHGFIVVNPIPLLGVWCARLDGLCFPSDFFISKIGGTLLLAQKKC